ncbi:MAG: spore maturation protein [Firmicutes bacterium]|nr:spore maturation protein [Bacillota bacterium]
MNRITDYVIPAIFLIVFIAATCRKIPSYREFTRGASGAVELTASVFPYLAAMLIAVRLMRTSGISLHLAEFVAPALLRIGIPKELTELIILRPFTGSGSTALVSEIIKTHGPDSYIARCACVIVGSSDTVFYVAALYFANTKVKKLRYGLPVAIIALITGVIVSCLVCKWI